jgi:hypothetical protein
MASVIKLKNGSGAPATGDLVQGEPAFDLTNKRLYTENASGAIIEVGTNPSVLTTTTGMFSGVVTIGDGHTIGDDAFDNLVIASSAGENLILDGKVAVLFYEDGAEVGRFAGGNFTPSGDNTQTNGGPSNRWSVIHAGTGTINTSDAREKTVVVTLTDDEIEAAKQLGNEIGIFQWLASVEEKGSDARRHVGMTVQRAIEIMTSCNLNPMAYGFICYDEWLDEFVEHAATPDVDAWTEQTKWAGNRYGFRTSQLNSFIAAGFNARLTALEAL